MYLNSFVTYVLDSYIISALHGLLKQTLGQLLKQAVFVEQVFGLLVSGTQSVKQFAADDMLGSLAVQAIVLPSPSRAGYTILFSLTPQSAENPLEKDGYCLRDWGQFSPDISGVS